MFDLSIVVSRTIPSNHNQHPQQRCYDDNAMQCYLSGVGGVQGQAVRHGEAGPGAARPGEQSLLLAVVTSVSTS